MAPVSEFRWIPCPKPIEKIGQAREYDDRLGFPDRYHLRRCRARIGVHVHGKTNQERGG